MSSRNNPKISIERARNHKDSFFSANTVMVAGSLKPSRTKDILQFQYNSMEPGKDEFQPASQSYLQDSLSSSMHTDMRSNDLNIPEIKPVHNYSIQTGEEFALQFMLDRVNPRKPLNANAVGDPSYATDYIELKGILGISNTGSESGSDTSMLPLAEKGQTSLKETGHLYMMTGITMRQFNQYQELHQAMKIVIFIDMPLLEPLILPGEDLDALVSVSCDEDLQNMMEEWNELEDKEGPQKLRMFLFSMSDLDDAQFGLHGVDGDSEVQYVVAVNGMDLGSRKNSTLLGMTSTLTNNLDELNGQNIEKETSRVAKDSIQVGTSSLTGNIVSSRTVQSSEPMLPNFSNAYDTYPHFQHSQVMHYGQNVQYSLHNGHTLPSHSPFGGTTVSVPHHGIMNQQGGSIEEQPSSRSREQNFEMPVKQVKRDGSLQQESDPEKLCPSGKEHSVPLQLYDGNLMNHLPVEEASKDERKYQEPEKVASSIDSGNPVLVHKSSEIEHNSTSGNAFAPAYADHLSNGVDFSYQEPAVLPKRVYYSERIPREQAELLNRSSKSDDSHGSPFLITHSHSDVTQKDPITEGVNKLHEHGNLAPQTEQSTPTVYVDAQTVDDGLAQLQKYKEFADSISQMNTKLLQDTDGELKRALPTHVDNIETAKRDRILESDQETNFPKDSHKNNIVEAGSLISGIPSVKHQELSASNHSELNQEEATGKDPSTVDTMGRAQPITLTGKLSKDVSQETAPVGASTPVEGDIIIDIEERFPRDFLSDIFSKAVLSEDSPDFGLLQKDGTGLSLNMENHEPRRWSYFQKLAQEGFDKKDVSLIDQDLGFPSVIGNDVEGDGRSYHLTPLIAAGVSMVHVDSQPKFAEDIQKDLPGMTQAETTVLHSNYDQLQVKDTESMQFEGMMENIRAQDSEYEEGNFASRKAGLPPLDPSLGDFDISTLQLIKNDDLEQLKELGSGTFGTVYHGKWRGSDVAIKRLNKSCFTGRSSEQERLSIEFWREADILSKLHHPNVVAFYGVVQDGPGGTLATVTEYMVDGSLRHVLLRKDRYLDRRKRLIIAMDAAFGMEYLHSKNIVHFDLKCDNLLVNLKDPVRPICKVGDFGLSKIKRNTLVSGGVRGTLPWMAPELLNGSSTKVDVFSFGIVLWEILTGEEPYANMHYGAIIGGIVNNTLRPTIPSYCDPEWRVLMEQCWAPNPAARPSFTEIASCLRVMTTAASQPKAQGYKASK
ncbi:Protein kinase superfamily protein with octicosapeptide/Phox/Bem1p domain [Prunus dulcis]|uniref:Protein kinase superfamily protein with octicosapeptide/Phox/Bem1p domain n=1 Tax=Prunus dulcis TaxID=3755 RepID=A0A4Y1RBC1_PRUDU|nr:Protein kinase superfamily protein with octicosapeptide/Phox/Bem1p domain [Prunus dulcis]